MELPILNQGTGKDTKEMLPEGSDFGFALNMRIQCLYVQGRENERMAAGDTTVQVQGRTLLSAHGPPRVAGPMTSRQKSPSSCDACIPTNDISARGVSSFYLMAAWSCWAKLHPGI